MQIFRLRSPVQRILAVLMLLGLLFQVQTGLACEMSGHSMPVDECCCDDMKASRDLTDWSMGDGSCCDIRSELSLKEPDTSREQPAIISKSATVELPGTAPYLIPAIIWPEDFFTTGALPFPAASPAVFPSGTKTYLTTQRLRI